MKAISNGVFPGDNPLYYALPLVILQLCLVVLVTRLLDFLLRPRRQPRVIAEIVKSPQGPQKEVVGDINLCYQMGDEGADSGTATCGDFDVFLSFRGPDTRDTFTDCLYEYMNRTGIRIFRDEEALGPGKNISEILGAVKCSQIYIIVFSQGYASSRWCLRELTCMVECTRQSTGKEILPIFFDVEPFDVKLETEMYNSALNKHEKELGCAEVQPWKEALTTVARTRGWCVKGRRHGKVIADITETVLQKITIRKRYLPTDLVGIDDHVEAIKKLLSCDTGGVRFVIIHGIGGIGKTTLAETVYNQLFPQFEGHSFLSNIHESSSCHGILKMQRKLVEDLFGFLLHETIDPKEGNNMIKEILPKKRVLLVLDDMGEKDQFMNLAMNSYSYGPGSRIIITTRDFPMTNVDGLEENILSQSGHIFPYEMKEMHFDHALLLFNKLAFNTDSAPCDLYDLSRQVVELTGGLPLAVEVIGSHLRTISKAKWKTTLKKLKEVPHEKVRQRLQISYDALGCEGQQIFLDIGCFFVNKKKANAMHMWEACDFYPEVEIDILIRKSLIKIDNDRILMHGQLMDLAREIIRQENIRNCGDRSRLWFLEMFQAQKGTKNAVALTPRRSRHNFTREDFANFTKARFLRLDGGNFTDDCEDVLPELRWLSWQNCPSKLQANNLVLNRLVVLKLSGNITTEEWSGWVKIMVASKLKVLKIAGSKSLIRTPCFSEFMSLERLVLKDFLRLAEIDSSIGELRQLNYLKIKWCPRLRELPKEIGCLTALKELILIQGHSVSDLPDSIGNIRGLSRLVMEDTGLVELPDTIKGLVDLKHLCLVNCTNLNSLPDAVGELKSLTELDLSGTTVGNLPRFIWELENLTVRMNSFGIRAPLMRDLPMQGLSVRHSPDSIGNLRSWLRLSMDDRGSDGFLETINGLGDHEYLSLLDFANPSSLSDAAGELRTSTELYLSGTAIWEQEMEEMHFDHALQLFSEHAFLTDSAPCDLYDLSRQVVERNGSLGDWLCSSNRAKQLPRRVRQRIATELCSALAFLHSCKPHSIVHGDLKPVNILLDAHPVSNSTPVLCPTDPIGTFGYMDPEFLITRELTTKLDVYSFGIILLELLTRRPTLGIANVVQRAISAGTLEAMLDPLAGRRPYMLAEELTHLALRCGAMSRRNWLDLWRVESDPIDRSIQRVSTKLETPVLEGMIYVAVGKDMKEDKAKLAWAVHQSGGKVKICIIHVLVPSQTIPMGGLDEIMPREHRENERMNMHKITDTYLRFCQKMGAPVEKEYVESNIIHTGIGEPIRLHGIRKLVIDATAARRYFKYVQEQTTYLSENREVRCLHITRKVAMVAAATNRYFRKIEIKSRKAVFVRDKAHVSYPIWFIYDRHLIRPRDLPPLTTSTLGAGNSILSQSESATLQRSGTAKLSNPFQDILKRAFSSADRRAAMPIASPSPDSTPSVQPSAASMVKRQVTFQEIGQFSRSPAHHPHSIQSDDHIGSLLFNTLKKLEEELEKAKDQLDTVMEKLRVAQAQSRKELELKIIEANEMSRTLRQERELLQIDFENALQKAKEVSRRKGDSSRIEYLSEFSMTEIWDAAQNFDPSLKIREGSYGSVYRGFLRHTPVAIKIMKFPSMQGSQEFRQEVDTLSKVRHPNLITPIGACPDPCTLVYEHIPNGSLGDWLRSSNRVKQSPWQVQMRTAMEFCSVLAFLHSCTPHSIVHRDVKPGNILLDAHPASKLSDFGICRLLSRGKRSTNSTTVGSFGYMDPEFLVTRELTTKSDVYSFGIILLELLTRRPALGIANVVQRAISAGTSEAMLDPLAGEWPYKLAEELTRLALRCCEMSRMNRLDLRSDVWTVLQSIGASCR